MSHLDRHRTPCSPIIASLHQKQHIHPHPFDSALTAYSPTMPVHRHGKTVEAGGTKEMPNTSVPRDEWAIESVVFGDGSRDAKGFELRRGVFYASAKARGRHENYHRVDFRSIAFSTRDGIAQSLPTLMVSKGRPDERLLCRLPAEAINRRRRNVREQRKLISQAFPALLMEHPGVAVIIGGPGMRGNNVMVKPHLHRAAGKVFMMSNDGRCVHAALVNAVGCLRNVNEAHVAKQKLQSDSTHFINLKPLGLVAHKLDGFDIRRPSKEMRRLLSDKETRAFSIIGQLKRGVWIVRLCQSQVVDHCVVIDGERGLIFDSAEEYPITLSERTLRMCGGSSANQLHIAEIREVVDIKN